MHLYASLCVGTYMHVHTHAHKCTHVPTYMHSTVVNAGACAHPHVFTEAKYMRTSGLLLYHFPPSSLSKQSLYH